MHRHLPDTIRLPSWTGPALLWATLLSGAVGCSPEAEIEGEVAGVEVSLSHGIAESLLTGEPGREIVFREYGAKCNGPSEVGDHMLFMGWKMEGVDLPAEVPEGKYVVGENEVSGFTVSVGAAFNISGSSDWHVATGGSVELDSVGKSTYRGTLDLEFADGGELAGRFDVKTCERP